MRAGQKSSFGRQEKVVQGKISYAEFRFVKLAL